MYRKKTICNLLIGIFLLILFTASNGYALGQLTEQNFHGVGSDVGYGSYITDQWFYEMNNLYPSIDQTVESSLLNGEAWAKTSPYDMHGYLNGSIATNGYTWNDTEDELYFTTANGNSASLDFNFNLNFTAQVITNTKAIESYDTQFEILLAEDSVGWVDRKRFKFRSEESADFATNGGIYDYFVDLYSTNVSPDVTFPMIDGSFNFSSPIALSTAGWLGSSFYKTTDGLVESGTYLPIMIVVIAQDSSENMIIDYSNSFVIDPDNPYNAYAEDGNKLDPTSFTLSSPENFTKSSPAVPEPTTMILFGLGLLSLAGASRRKK